MVEVEIIAAYEKMLKRKLTEKEKKRLDEIERHYELARTQFIVIHRINNYAYDTCLRVYDEMEKRGAMKFKAKLLYKKLDKIWHDYLKIIRDNTEEHIYYLLQDNFMLTTDVVRPYVDGVVSAIRDYLISFGVRDTQFVAEAETAIQMLKICTHSYKEFFEDYRNLCGIDFSNAFMYANMEKYNAVFLQLVSNLNLVTGYDVFRNNRVQSAWSKMMEVIRDEDIMDEQAEKAIHLNPVIEKQYNKELEAIEQRKLADKVSELSEKFKVSKKN